MTLRRWKFVIVDEDDNVHYVGPNGETGDDETEWIGTDHEAAQEADRRSDLWESRPENGLVLKATYMSMGRIE